MGLERDREKMCGFLTIWFILKDSTALFTASAAQEIILLSVPFRTSFTGTWMLKKNLTFRRTHA